MAGHFYSFFLQICLLFYLHSLPQFSGSLLKSSDFAQLHMHMLCLHETVINTNLAGLIT